MPASVWWEWMAFHQIDPITAEREDYRAGVIAATVANAHRRKGARAMKPGDFMPKFGRRRRQSVDEMIKIAEEITKAMGGQDLRSERPH